jgi:peptide/nickel transport system substrate-binding protein
LSPYEGNSQGDFIFFEMMYDRLTSYNRDLELETGLATEWEPNDDGSEWTFTLREDATFATIDQQVLAEDVEASVGLMQEEERAPGASADLYGATSVEVEDDSRFTISLSNPDPRYPNRLAETGSWFNIAPKNVIEDRWDEITSTDFGSGPFTLTNFEQDDVYEFEGSDDWFETDENGNTYPYVDRVTVQNIPDQVAQTDALTGERQDTLQVLQPQQRTRVDRSDVTQPESFRSPALLSMVLNTTVETENGDQPFADNRVRQAMKHALDREEISAATDGTMVPGNHSGVAPVHPNVADFDPGLEFGTTAQLDEARALLEEAGYGDGLTLPKPIYEREFQARRETAVLLFQEQMAEVGIEFDIQLVTPDTWLSEYWNQDGVWYASGFAARIEETTVQQLAMQCDGRWNSGRWCNEDYQAAYDTFSTTTDQETYVENFKEAQRVAHLNNAWIVFGYLRQFGASNNYVNNHNPGPALNKDFNFDTWLSSDAPEGPD